MVESLAKNRSPYQISIPSMKGTISMTPNQEKLAAEKDKQSRLNKRLNKIQAELAPRKETKEELRRLIDGGECQTLDRPKLWSEYNTLGKALEVQKRTVNQLQDICESERVETVRLQIVEVRRQAHKQAEELLALCMKEIHLSMGRFGACDCRLGGLRLPLEQFVGSKKV